LFQRPRGCDSRYSTAEPAVDPEVSPVDPATGKTASVPRMIVSINDRFIMLTSIDFAAPKSAGLRRSLYRFDLLNSIRFYLTAKRVPPASRMC
jgi:hypothetical protein